jgi:NACalpha-BTF3-like transcription factor
MNLRNNSCRISLVSIFICFFIPQVQAGFLDDAVNRVKSATEEVIKDTADDATNNNDKSSSSPSKVSTNAASEEKKQAVKNSTATEKTANQHSDIDIIGLKLGMTLDQVIAALKTHNKDLKVRIQEFKKTSNERKQAAHLPDHVRSIDARIGSTRPPYDIITVKFSSPPSNNVVNKIERSVAFAPDILTDTLVSALKEKYGPPTSKRDPLIWDYTKSDKKAECMVMLRKGKSPHHVFPTNTCVELVLSSNVTTLKETLSELRTVLIDHEEIKRQNLATNSYRSQLMEERRQAHLKKASQKSAPKL